MGFTPKVYSRLVFATMVVLFVGALIILAPWVRSPANLPGYSMFLKWFLAVCTSIPALWLAIPVAGILDMTFGRIAYNRRMRAG